jgi:hypothetical protein
LPKDGRHWLGVLERNHAVRREQIGIYEKVFPNDSFGTALRMTNNARNRLRNAGGRSPNMLALGQVSRLPAGLCDDDFKLAEQAAVTDTKSAAYQDMLRRTTAAEAYFKANTAAVLARNQPIRTAYAVGEWVFYWRALEGAMLDKVHWHGLRLVCAVEVRDEGDAEESPRMESVYWVAHGSSLPRCIPELLRAELPNDRDWREENMKETGEGSNYANHVKEALKTVKGPVEYHDLAQQAKPDAKDFMDDVFEQPSSPPAPSVPAAGGEPSVPSPGAAPATASSAAPAAAAEECQAGHGIGGHVLDPEARGRVRIRNIAMDDYNRARRLDGLPAATKRPRMSFESLDTVMFDSVDQPAPADDDQLWVDVVDYDVCMILHDA